MGQDGRQHRTARLLTRSVSIVSTVRVISPEEASLDPVQTILTVLNAKAVFSGDYPACRRRDLAGLMRRASRLMRRDP